MKSLINSIILGMTTVAFVSCTGDYLEINSNPYQPGDLTPDGYGLSSAMSNIAGCVVSPDVNTAQFTDCLLGGPMGGYYADSKVSGWDNTISNYNPTDNWTNVFLKSDRIIPVLYTNLTVVEKLCEESGDDMPLMVANIIKVAAMSRVTDTYGPIPYSQIGKDGKIETPYDPQDKVYDKFFEELTNSVNALNAKLVDNPDYTIPSSADYVYKGDVKKWIRFANSLKMRLAMRIVYADKEKAQARFVEAMDPVNGGIMEQNDQNAMWDYFKSSSNPIYVASRYNSAEGSLTGGDSHAAADIICYMNGYNDNRREKYFVKSEYGYPEYVGVRRGIELSTLGKNARKYSGINVAESDPVIWMNAAETYFLRAEAVAVHGFTNPHETMTAKDLYEEGIRKSFEQWGADLGYYLEDGYSTPQTYNDPESVNSYSERLSEITVKWNDGAAQEEKQERIIIQKWIANWTLGNEAWADYRRTGYPKLIPATAEGNKSGGKVDSELGARRMPYPADEYVSNKNNVLEAVSEYLKGADEMGTFIWWDCKPKN
ncbi:SusD/RagB family nutrient-binding outer membrane lipoprotein [uncultured Bacteroides sp.]|uniref:SusD/RagB family nutrient-binding outer membrane lipoprotein n=1 Tax=uncultured Bacteroides sp. TaxID=162156 RepID=UPI0025CBE627|nr:SusD/RagB family nutrient-binding outer membrane lipoprotein [uncultured Bacteroides sp.]